MMLSKLNDNFRCMFLGSPTTVAWMQLALADAGLGVSEVVKKGSLLLSSSQDHLHKGVFDSQRMLDMLKEYVEDALSGGYAGLWISGDMTWEFGGEENLVKLMEYECGLEKLFRTTPHLYGVCQYHMDTLPLHVIGNALFTHKTVYINHTLQRVSPHYLQPEALKSFTPKPLDRLEIDRVLREAAVHN
jgi:hypothetical protein